MLQRSLLASLLGAAGSRGPSSEAVAPGVAVVVGVVVVGELDVLGPLSACEVVGVWLRLQGVVGVLGSGFTPVFVGGGLLAV